MLNLSDYPNQPDTEAMAQPMPLVLEWDYPFERKNKVIFAILSTIA